MITRIVIPGKPISKNRPRFARRGKFVKTYSDQATESGKFFLVCREQVRAKLDGPIFVQIRFEIPRPKSHYGTGKNSGILKESAPKWPHMSRQDLDNLEKFALDCLNGLAWDDDRQICEMRSSKHYAPDGNGRTVIFIDHMGWEEEI